MSYFKICSDAFNSLDSVSLRFRPKTDDPVENGRVIAESFERASESERERLLDAVAPSLATKLLGLSGFMADAAINSLDKSLIRPSILLHVVEGFRKDYRENYRYLVLIAYASNQLGVDVKHDIESVAHLASSCAARCLKDFMSRDNDLNSLGSFGIKADVSDGLFRFIPT